MRETILTQEIYCTNPNTKPDYQYGSWVCKGLGTQYTQIIQEYDLAAAIYIQPLTQPCEMGSSIFAAMSQTN